MVPSGQKLHYVLIAAIIGAIQIAVIVAVVMCFTRYSQCYRYYKLSSSWLQQLLHLSQTCLFTQLHLFVDVNETKMKKGNVRVNISVVQVTEK